MLTRNSKTNNYEKETLILLENTEFQGKPDAMFSCDSELTLNTLLARNRGNEPGDQCERCVHFVFRFADPSNVGRSLLEGNKDHLLDQARSELMKQEHQVGSLNSCINELQQQAHAQRLESPDAHHGFFESRREQARLHEELSMKEKVLRDTQIRNIHEMGEMKRDQRTTSWRILSTKI